MINNSLNINTTGLQSFDASTGTVVGRTISASAGISVSNGNGVSGNPTIAVTGAGLGWTAIGASQSITKSNGYFCTAGGALSLDLPAVSAVGDTIEIALDGSTSWTITQPNAATQIRFGNQQTTLGVGGSLSSTAQGDCVRLVCQTTNGRWQATPGFIGNLNFV